MHNFQLRKHVFFLAGLLIILITGACTEANIIPINLDIPEGEAAFLFFYTDN